MPKLVEPAKWEAFVDLLAKGWYPTEAAREVGIDPRTAQRFLSGNPRCSGRRWLASRKASAAIRSELGAIPAASTSPAGRARGIEGEKGSPPSDPPAPIVHHHQERTA